MIAADQKNMMQTEIDAVCELADFFRFNVAFMTQIYQDQPLSSEGIWNRMQYRPLEGFVYAITPFNFTSIAGNFAILLPALMWKA
ncbi:MAG: aldehyde dehydrogenase family protein [Flavobacteriaceae bacterium]|nr:aldehyde dehydrogenase family protein [Flavobacteriaceae bacterium]